MTPGGDGAGLHLIAWLPTGWDAEAVARRAAEQGVATPSVTTYYQGQAGRPGLMLGFAALDEQKIAQGIRRLARAIDDERATESRRDGTTPLERGA